MCQGQSVNGLSPHSSEGVRICKHKHGFDFSFDSNTDVIISGKYEGLEAAHYANNLGGTLFGETLGQPKFQDIEDAGRMQMEMYFKTVLVDENNTVSDQFNLQNTYLPNNASVLSLASGIETYNAELESIGLINGIRNSQVTTDFGIVYNNYDDLSDAMNRRNTTRFINDDSVSSLWGFRDNSISATVFDNLRNIIDRTINEKGFFNNFTHFHWVYDFEPQTEDYVNFLEVVNERLRANQVKVYSGGYGSINEYLWLRENSTIVFDNNTIEVVTIDSLIPNYDNFTQSLTVRYKNSRWDGLSCTNCEGVRKDGNNYYIDILPNTTATISENASAIYYDFSIPKISSYNISGNTISVTTNMPTKVAVYLNDSGEPYHSSPYPAKFSNTLGLNHSIVVSTGYDYWIGVISEMGQSDLIKI